MGRGYGKRARLPYVHERRLRRKQAAPDRLAVPSRGLTWTRVSSWTLRRHQKLDRYSLRIEYRSGATTFYEWLALEHDGAAREIAVAKWRKLGGRLPAPATVKEAITRYKELHTDIKIAVRHDGKYWRVINSGPAACGNHLKQLLSS